MKIEPKDCEIAEKRIDKASEESFTIMFANGSKIFCEGLKDQDRVRGSNFDWLLYEVEDEN